MQVAMVGLGRMGGNMARRLIRGGHVAYARDAAAMSQLAATAAIGTRTLDEPGPAGAAGRLDHGREDDVRDAAEVRRSSRAISGRVMEGCAFPSADRSTRPRVMTEARNGDDGDGRPVIAIMAKAPRVGTVKTRLCPPLSAEDAAALSRAFIADKVEQVRSVDAARGAIVYTPDEGREFFEELAPDFILISQRGTDLGARLVSSFDWFFAEGYPAAAFVDSDSPTLPREFLLQALDLVMSPDVDVVLGPSADGGYYLIGLRIARPELFIHMPWSTPRMFAETAERARQRGLRVASLPLWFDVDTALDLVRLESTLRSTLGPAPRHTRQFFSGRAR